ncbi:MAG TPA: FtsQ-type POTRA domain-containing protein [Solirubrobacterales bacterium]
MATRALNPRRPVPGPSTRPRTQRPTRSRGAVLRRRLVAAAIVIVALYAGYMLWFRNLSWFAIHDVTVKGATTSRSEIKDAVQRVAGDMTTLHIKDDELRDAVARFPTVASVGASTSFPHGLEVTITERLPIAFARLGGRDIAVSADGYLLNGASFDRKALPRIEGAAAQGARLDEDAAAQAAILGATPAPLRDRVTASIWDEDRGGVVLDLKNGPEVRFGDGSRAREKWEAAVTVLSSDERGSPSYLDVSVPERPVSGG